MQAISKSFLHKISQLNDLLKCESIVSLIRIRLVDPEEFALPGRAGRIAEHSTEVVEAGRTTIEAELFGHFVVALQFAKATKITAQIGHFVFAEILGEFRTDLAKDLDLFLALQGLRSGVSDTGNGEIAGEAALAAADSIVEHTEAILPVLLCGSDLLDKVGRFFLFIVIVGFFGVTSGRGNGRGRSECCGRLFSGR